ncbi:MAG TPA: non-homologous end-joining DNA ligase [Dehalococcoidia bacterium]|nr:non-homologous end-joining DNA ligase [Dehalococcoidia bacterium]
MPRRDNKDVLEDYKKKRDFTLTSEPPPEVPDTGEGRLIFIVQKHDATRLHYDVRFEVDGVLKSFPVPKGPSYDPADKRLAVMTEDHPMSYASYEGVIPKGEYGAGPVIVWDAGTFSPDEEGLHFDDREEAQRQMREGIAKGKISVFLQGVKLKGSWTFVKTKQDWLMIKHKDRFVDPDRDVTTEDRSVISGLSIADLMAGRLPDARKNTLICKPEHVPGAVQAAFPRSIEPMQATLTNKPFAAPDWYFEPKLDGVRALAFIDGDNIRLISRRGIDQTKQYPEVVESLKGQTERMVLDGEIIALNEKGVPSFQVIQQRLGIQREKDIARMAAEVTVYYYVFDILWAGGYDIRGGRLCDRTTLLKQLVLPDGCVALLEHFDEDGVAAYKGAVAHGFEGVLAKKRDCPYESGRRSKNWLKVKATTEDDFIVGGFTSGLGGRNKTFGSLLVGQYDDEGKLAYAGNVGSGFNDKLLATLRKRLDSLTIGESPFDVMTPGSTRFARPKDVAITWVKPELVATVKFTEWTNDGHLRAPSLVGMRTDKAPEDVHREMVTAPPREAAGAVSPAGGDDVAEVLEQLGQKKQELTLRVSGHKLKVTNLDKELWPPYEGQRGLTKRDLLTYFARISPYLLPDMKDRPLTLTRYPNGITKGHFYQKHYDQGEPPEFVATVDLWSGQNEEDGTYLMCNNLPTLLWLGQLADIELHTWYSRVNPDPDGAQLPETYAGSDENFEESRLNYPDFIVFDLDPYIYSGEERKGDEPDLNMKAFKKTVEVAMWLKELLDAMSLSSFVKTTGKTGLHVYVPILRELDYDTVRTAAETIGKFLLRAHPRDITMEWATQKRKGKIFFDHGQNAKGKTLASVYSPRPLPWAGVSMPVRWDELNDVYPKDFTILNVPERVAEAGDLWGGILNEKHDLRSLLAAVPEEG